MTLHWPAETLQTGKKATRWSQSASNMVLDFHGDPFNAEVIVFSDGNHHMALLPSLQDFVDATPGIHDVFYATTPPGPLVSVLQTGALQLGNLTLSIRPHLFISPPHILNKLHEEGFLDNHRLLARNQGSVLLVARNNPKAIKSIADLMREDVRLFISNPDSESVSYLGYRKTLIGMAAAQGLNCDDFEQSVFTSTLVPGECIHHREAPEAVASGAADAAIVYYHLALRYVRIFPELFEMVFLDGTQSQAAAHPQNRTAATHMALVGDGGPWGETLMTFLLSRTVADIYHQHGLRHVLDDDPEE